MATTARPLMRPLRAPYPSPRSPEPPASTQIPQVTTATTRPTATGPGSTLPGGCSTGATTTPADPSTVAATHQIRSPPILRLAMLNSGDCSFKDPGPPCPPCGANGCQPDRPESRH